MPSKTREALLFTLSTYEAELALDDVLSEGGFERVRRPPPRPKDSIARCETRFFDVDALEPTLSIVREWNNYRDATSWGAALGLSEGLPPAARMEMALPPALSVLARALSRRAQVLGFSAREDPWHFVGVAFRDGRAFDVITAVKDRVMLGPQAQPRASTPQQARTHLDRWLTPYHVSPVAIELVFGNHDLTSSWRLAYFHA